MYSIYIYINTWCNQICVYMMCLCFRWCLYVYVCNVCTCMRMYVRICMHARTHVHVRCMHACMHTREYIYILPLYLSIYPSIYFSKITVIFIFILRNSCTCISLWQNRIRSSSGQVGNRAGVFRCAHRQGCQGRKHSRQRASARSQRGLIYICIYMCVWVYIYIHIHTLCICIYRYIICPYVSIWYDRYGNVNKYTSALLYLHIYIHTMRRSPALHTRTSRGTTQISMRLSRSRSMRFFPLLPTRVRHMGRTEVGTSTFKTRTFVCAGACIHLYATTLRACLRTQEWAVLPFRGETSHSHIHSSHPRVVRVCWLCLVCVCVRACMCLCFGMCVCTRACAYLQGNIKRSQ
jgi:hypothetical protein